MEGVTIVAGIPIPSTSPWFLGVVALHVAMGLVCVVVGAAAMLARKGRGRHSRYGTIYFWFLSGVFVTATALSIARWRENDHLFVLGVLSFGAAVAGRQMLRSGPITRTRLRLHLVGMAASYVLLLTAFYVDNGKNLPLWKELPTIAYWLIPAAVGVPLVIRTLLRHPLVRPTHRRAGNIGSQ
jgi:hypothetical protein